MSASVLFALAIVLSPFALAQTGWEGSFTFSTYTSATCTGNPVTTLTLDSAVSCYAPGAGNSISDVICSTNSARWTGWPTSTTCTGINRVNSLTNGQCTRLPGQQQVFGKLINYVPCKKVYSNVCEGTVGTLSCPLGMLIHTTDAHYRADSGTCGGPVVDPTCNFDVTNVVGGVCDGKSTCDIPIENYMFTDPCFGTKKELYAHNECVNGSTIFSCESQNATLECPVGKTLSVISAYYTADQGTCGGPVVNPGCAFDVTATIAGECNGLNSCVTMADNNHFGDPCYGTKKQLQGVYFCA